MPERAVSHSFFHTHGFRDTIASYVKQERNQAAFSVMFIALAGLSVPLPTVIGNAMQNSLIFKC